MQKKVESKFEWDVAFSLCHQDFKLANEICLRLNPSIKKFFYGQNQQEIISKSGPEKFADTFKNKSRLVVILYRKEWSETFYTDLERNAIIDRIKNGFDFIFMIQLAPNETPPWYPETKIYVRAYEYTVEEIVKFIEFKLTELNVKINPETFNEKILRLQELKKNLQEKKNYLLSKDSQPKALELIKGFTEYFNSVLDNITISRNEDLGKSIFYQTGGRRFGSMDFYQDISGEIFLNRIGFSISIQFLRGGYICSQSFILNIAFLFNKEEGWGTPTSYRVNIDIHNYQLMGWSKEKEIPMNSSNYMELYMPQYFDPTVHYELEKEIYTSENLIDESINTIIHFIEKNDPIFKR